MLGRPSKLPEIDVPEGGTVTAIKQQVNDPDRCSVFLDGEFAFGIHAQVVASAGLSSGMDLDRAACEKLIHEDVYHRAWSRALDYLSHKSRTSTEVQRRMRDIGAPEEVSARVVDRLKELGYLDDRDYAKRYVESRLRSRGYGPRRLEQELRKKGIPRRAAEQAVAGLNEEEVSRTLDNLAARAVNRYRRVDDDRERRQKATAWLARRGYAYDRIRTALDRLDDGDTPD